MTTRPGFSLCICPDGKMLRQQIDALIAEYPASPEMPQWERHVFWGDEELPRQFWEQVTLQGLFPTFRVVVIRTAQMLPAEIWKRLSSTLGHPNPQAWPIVCLEGAWEKGQPKIPAHILKLACFTFAEKQGWVYRSPGLDPRSLKRHIQMQARALGMTFAPGALEVLSETLPPDASAVASELGKLAILAGGEPLSSDAARLVSRELSFNIFSFLRQLQSGQSAVVWKSILDEQRKGEEPLFYLLVMLQREARMLWQVLAGEQVRMSPSDLPARRETASRLGVTGLAQLWDLMHTAELSVKSGRCSPSQALDALMAGLTRLFSR